MKAKEITKEFLEDFRPQLNYALQELGEKHGLKITTGGASYSDTFFSIKLEGSVVAEEGVATTKDQIAFKNNAELYGLSPDDLFKTFEAHGKVYEVWGLRPRAKSYPIIAKRVGSTQKFKFGAETVAFHLGIAKAKVK